MEHYNLAGLSARNRAIFLAGVSGADGSGTATLPELEAKALANLERVKAIADGAVAGDRELTDTERETIKALMDEARDIKRRRDNANADTALAAEIAELGGGLTAKAVPVTGPAVDANGRRKSLGERFTADESIAAFLAKSAGMQSEHARIGQSPALEFKGFKDILAGSDTDAGPGTLVTPDNRGVLDAGVWRRPLTIRNLVTNGTTGSDSVEFVREVSVENNAAPVPEATGTSAGDASADVPGTKPESELVLEKATAPVRTIAHWIPATKRALSDAAQIRTLIDNFLRYGLEEELEDQIVNGDGTGENFEGILTVDGTQDQPWATDLLVTTRKAKTKAKTVGRVNPTAYVFNPEDNERIDLLQDENGVYYFGGPAAAGQQSLWGLPRVESEAVPAGTGILADWSRAVLWDRESAAIQVSDSHADFFVRNLVAILAELRAAFGVIRPSAFVVIDLTA